MSPAVKIPKTLLSRRPGFRRAFGKGGFTLVELVVGLLCCSVVTLGAVTLTLAGLRVQAKAADNAGQQQTARIVLTLMENLAASGKVTSVEQVGDSWTLWGGDSGNDALLQYRDGTITTGGTALLDGLSNAAVELKGQLLTLTVNTGEETWATSAYCRMAITGTTVDADYAANLIAELTESASEETGGANEAGTYAARAAFLSLLCTQYGSTGAVLDSNGRATELTYSLWYCGESYWEGWSADTPWCACFLSWAAAEIYAEQQKVDGSVLQTTAPYFAGVDDGISAFQKGTNGASWRERSDTPLPGDYIFFDWEQDNDPDHVGAVLAVDTAKNLVYTIEGNNGGAVTIHSYALDDARIVGYGVLDWAET